MRLLLTGSAVLVISVAVVHAAPPARLVADIADRPFGFPFFPVGTGVPVVWEGKLYFAFDDGIAGRELFVSDGTVEGTRRVADICPGVCWGMQHQLVASSNALFFTATDRVHGGELWVSDGTEGGARLVKDIAPGLSSSNPDWLTVVGDDVFFTADDRVHGRELWVSDGTPDGTVRVADLRDGPEGSFPRCLAPLENKVFFVAFDDVHGQEPWVATPSGATLLSDIVPGTGSGASANDSLTRFPWCETFAGEAYFFADDGVHGPELWKTDGTSGGTVGFDLVPGSDGLSLSWMRATSSWLYFAARSPDSSGREIWRSDGSESGTFQIRDIAPGDAGSNPWPLAEVAGTFYFVAWTAEAGEELWKTRGDEATTEMVKDIAPGPGGAFSFFALATAASIDDRLLFFADDGDHGLEPWVTDGEPAGTHLLIDVTPGSESSVAPFGLQDSDARSVGERAFFFTFTAERGVEPWITDGGAAGTLRLRAADPPASSILDAIGFLVTDPADVDGRLVFGAWTEDAGLEPWITSGTAATTRLLGDLEPGETNGFADGSSPSWPVRLGHSLLFHSWLLPQTEAGPNNALWVTDREGSAPEDLVSLPSILQPVAFADRVFFSADDGVHGWEIWSSEGMPETTGLFADLVPGEDGSGAGSFTPVGDRLYFTARIDGRNELWSLAGDDLEIVAELPSDSSFPGDLVAFGDVLLFSLGRPETGREPWKSDGTTSGTGLIADVAPGPADGLRPAFGLRETLSPIAAAGPTAYFLGEDGVHGEELWRTDATAAGTALVGDLRPGPLGSEPRWLTAVGDRLFFTANDGTHGRELWRTDPAAGAILVADLVPGEGSSNPGALLEVDGRLWFSAYRPDVGVELWTSDGTEAGTVLVQDVAAGPESASPGRLAVSGRRLYFFAQDGTHGFEPWALLLPGRLPRGRLTVAGDLSPGGLVILTLVIDNPPPEELADGIGDELVLELPAVLVPLAVEATSGEARIETGGSPLRAAAEATRASAAATAGPSVVTWNGSLPPGGSATVTIHAQIGLAQPGTTVSLQGVVSFDSDHDGVDDESLLTDDPGSGGDEQPTLLVVAAPQSAVEIPTLSDFGLLLLAALVLLAARRRLG